MKQFLTVFFCLFLSITGYAENKIKMVTYFPVPYVAYSKVNVTDQMDIGLTTSCIMNLGCTESGNAGLRPLNVTNTILNKGKLELNTAAAVSGSAASIGSGSGSGSMNFNSNLRVNTLNDGVSVEANNITVDTLKLFPNRITTDFPSCASTGAPGAPNISWQKLKLKDKEEVYLMCGNAKEAEPEADCSDNSYKQSHKSECCPNVGSSDPVCYIPCNCSPQVSATSPQTVRQEQAVCKKVSGTCKWTHRQSYKTQPECYNYVLSQVSLPQGGSASCTFVNNPLNTSMYPPEATGCMERGGSCYVKPLMTPPSYSVEKSTFMVSWSCQRCKNGW